MAIPLGSTMGVRGLYVREREHREEIHEPVYP